MGATNVAAIRGGVVTLQAAADAFLSSPRCENPNTRRAYAGVVDNVIGQLGALRPLAEVTDAEIGEVVEGLWGTAADRRGTATGQR